MVSTRFSTFSAGEVELDRAGAHGEIVRVERDHEQAVQPLVQLDLPAPVPDPRADLLVRALIAIDRALDEKLGLCLRRSSNPALRDGARRARPQM